jgi:hypothetical protein
MRRKMPHMYVDAAGTATRLFEADVVTLQELAAELDPEREDLLLNPWRRSGRAAIRRALGH